MRFRPFAAIRLLVAGLVSSAIAGILGMFLAAMALWGPAALIALIFVGHAAVIGIKWTGATAVALGSILWILRASHPRFRQRRIWALTGVAAGLAHFFLPWPEEAVSTSHDPNFPQQFWVLPLIFMLSGAGAALAFRATMRVARPFVDDDEEEP